MRGSNVVWRFVAPHGQQNHFLGVGVAAGEFDPLGGGVLYRKLLRGCAVCREEWVGDAPPPEDDWAGAEQVGDRS